MSDNINKILTAIIMMLTAIIGIGSLSAFVIFIYSGPFNLVRLELTVAQAMIFNTMLSLMFFIQHSGMVRSGFRYRLSAVLPQRYMGVVYTIMSGITLGLFLLLWQESPILLVEASGMAELAMRILFFMAVAGTFWGMWALRFVDLFGIDKLSRHYKPDQQTGKPFTIRGPYRWVRHPLYLFTIIFIWSYPVITLDRLLFNVLWTVWIVIGTSLEERELVEEFGDSYRKYQSKVPMLLPCSIRPVYPAKSDL